MENKHEKKKATKTIKVQDLKPKKDAKGGVSVRSPNVIAKLVKTRRGNLRLKSSTLVQSLGAVFIYPFCNLLNRQPTKTKGRRFPPGIVSTSAHEGRLKRAMAS